MFILYAIVPLIFIRAIGSQKNVCVGPNPPGLRVPIDGYCFFELPLPFLQNESLFVNTGTKFPRDNGELTDGYSNNFLLMRALCKRFDDADLFTVPILDAEHPKTRAALVFISNYSQPLEGDKKKYAYYPIDCHYKYITYDGVLNITLFCDNGTVRNDAHNYPYYKYRPRTATATLEHRGWWNVLTKSQAYGHRVVCIQKTKKPSSRNAVDTKGKSLGIWLALLIAAFIVHAA